MKEKAPSPLYDASCRACGAERPAFAVHCWLCGAKLDGETPTPGPAAKRPSGSRAADIERVALILTILVMSTVVVGVFWVAPGYGIVLGVASAMAIAALFVKPASDVAPPSRPHAKGDTQKKPLNMPLKEPLNQPAQGGMNRALTIVIAVLSSLFALVMYTIVVAILSVIAMVAAFVAFCESCFELFQQAS